MQEKTMKNGRWIRISLFIIACAFSFYGVATNKVLFAMLASLSLFFAFCRWRKDDTWNEKKIKFIRYELTSDQLVASLALFFYAIVTGIVAAVLSPKISNGTLSLIFWVISIGLFFAAAMVFDKFKFFGWVKDVRALDAKGRRKFFLEVGAVSVITALALVLRTAYLGRFPTSMHGDEGEMGMEALRFLGIGDPISPMGIGWGPLPNLYYMMQAGTIALFGRNAVGLRVISALFGTACVPVVYLICKRSWGMLASFTGAWLIAVSSINIQYSRLAVNNMVTAFFMLFFILLFLKANSDSTSTTKDSVSGNDSENSNSQPFKITPYVALGVTGALAQYFYLGSRLVPLVAIPLVLVQLIRRRINLVQLSAMLISAVLVFAPLGLDYIRNPDQFSTRMGAVSIFNADNIHNNYGPDATLTNSVGKILVSQFNKNLSYFLKSGDNGSFYYANVPAFDAITAFLFWLGLGVIFTRPRRLPELAMLVWFFLGIILAGVITNDSPNGTRLLIITSVVFICCGAFVQRAWDELNKIYKQIPNLHISLEWIVAPILAAAIGATLYFNLNYNFVIYPNAGINLLSISVAEEINADGANNHIYLFGIGDLYANHGTLRFLAGDYQVTDIKNLEDIPSQEKDGKGITVLATYTNFDKIAGLESIFPQGKLSDVYHDGYMEFKKYQVPPLP